MGLEIDRETFDDEEYRRFSARLEECVKALELLLAREEFGEGESTIGAECELDLVDGDGRPLNRNLDVLSRTGDPRVVCEVDRFNLEVNTRPARLAGTPFARLEAEFDETLALVTDAAKSLDGRVATIGILPTLRETDLSSSALTEKTRYRALSFGVRRLRQRPFDIEIHGTDAIKLRADDVAFEGANTSLQVHLKIPPSRFAAVYNAAQLATSMALAVSGNAPLFLGRRLWDETRIALFRQSVDERVGVVDDEWRPARVTFGHGFARRGAHEHFAEGVALHEPILPILSDERPLDVVARGGVPKLSELRLHQGTTWRWNRAVYDDVAGGHVRIEMRALPAGPTPRDMAANAAFLLGATLALEPDIERWLAGVTFTHARRNFYAAARHGLDATLVFPDEPGQRAREIAARTLVERMLDPAHTALVAHGVESSDAHAALDVIARRVACGQTGAVWQRRAFERFGGVARPDDACALVVKEYIAHAATKKPVHTW